MTLSTGARSVVGYVAEVTYGTVPVTPALKAVPFSSFGITVAKDELVDNRIDGSRDVKDLRYGNKNVTGEMSGDFSAQDYDDFIASAMLNTWTANAITIGSTVKSMVIEESQLDIVKYRKTTGAVVTTMSIEAPIDGNATVTFGFNAKDNGYTLGGSTAGTSLDASGYTAAVHNIPFTHVNGTMVDDAGSLIGVVQGISLELDNGYESTFVWSKAEAEYQTHQKANVTGTITAYYVDEILINKFLNETESSLTFSLTDGTHVYTFIMDRIKYTGEESKIDGDGVRTISLPFRALKDNTNTTLKITRT